MSPPGNDRSRPAGTASSVEQLTGERDQVTIPLYRSDEFHRIAADDPRRLQSMERAATAWYLEGTTDRIVARLREADQEFRDRVRQSSYDLSAAGGWSELASAPTYEELRRRRAEPLVPVQRSGWSS